MTDMDPAIVERFVYDWCTAEARGTPSARALAAIYASTYMADARLLGFVDLRALDAGEFLRHHGVQPGRHDGAGHDLHAFAGRHRSAPGGAGQRRADAAQAQRLAGLQLRAVEGKAVHGRVVVRRHADGRDHVFGQHPAQRLGQRHALHFGDGLDQALQKGGHGVGVQRLRVVALQRGGDVGGARGGGGRGRGHSTLTISALSW